jgi:CRP-like cAMP-binding protein
MFNESCDQETVNECLAKRVVCICDVILKHPLFKNIQREQTHQLSNIADIITLDEKQVLLFKLQEIDRVYFVLRGRIKLHNYDNDSSKEYIYQISEQGDSVGLEHLYTPLNYYPYAAIAMSPSKVLSLRAKEFKEVIEDDPVIKTNFLEYVSRLSLDLYDRSKDFVLTSVAERLLKYLQIQSMLKDSEVFELEVSKTDLANYLGTISSTLSRAFKELEDQKQIEIDKNTIRLKKKPSAV